MRNPQDVVSNTSRRADARHSGLQLNRVAKWLSLGLIILFSSSAYGLDPGKSLDQYVHQSWTTDNGLPSNAIYAITQTRDGYLWIGTEGGLARFNGISFQIFDKASGQLPSDHVTSLAEGSDGALWIGTTGGLVRYRTGSFETPGQEVGLSGVRVAGIAPDQAGNIWIAANKLYRFHDDVFQAFELPDQQRIQELAVDPGNQVWMILSHSVVYRVLKNQIVPVPELAGIGGQALLRPAFDSQGALWLTAYGGRLYRFRNDQLSAFGPNEGLTSSGQSRAVQDKDGNIWLGTTSGLARIAGSKCTILDSDRKDFPSNVSVMYEDREGNLWTGTVGRGLHRFTDGSFTPFGPEQGLPEQETDTICEDFDGGVFVGTIQQLYQGRDRFISAGLENRLGENRAVVQDLLPDATDHSVWIGTTNGLFHWQGKSLVHYTKNEGLPSNVVGSLLKDDDGTLWIGAFPGLTCFKEGKFFLPSACQPAATGQDINWVAKDHEGGIWLGTSRGPMRYYQGQLIQFGQKDGLTDLGCKASCVDSEGTLWISTANGGLSQYVGGQFFTYLQKDGLPSDQIFAIGDDPEHGCLWLGSNKGVFRVDKKELADFRVRRIKHILGTNFGTADGLRSLEMSLAKVVRTPDGRLWWGTDNGLVSVDPNHLVLHTDPGPLVLERVVADGNILASKHLELAPGTGRLEIDYTALTYSAAGNLRFRYQLDGVDRDWFGAGQRREAFFTKLGPGNYRFRVQASADGGTTWKGSGAELTFSVLPHFYETWWFLGLCGATFAGLISGVFFVRRRQYECRFRAVLAERVRVAGEIHDSLAQGFASAAMLLDSMDRSVPTDSPLRTQHKSIRSILGSSLADTRSMIATLRGQRVESEKLQSALQKLVDRLSTTGSAPISLDFGSQEIPPVSVAVQQELLRICQEAVNNAIRHANAKHIWVTFAVEDQKRVHLAVADDGDGFDINQFQRSNDGTHFGLAGLSERAKRIDGRLEIRSQRGIGTELELILPLGKKNERKYAFN